MKKITLVFLILHLTVKLFSTEIIEERGFYFGMGGGVPMIFYREPIKSIIDDFKDSGASQIKFEYNITLGNAVGDNTFFVFTSSGYISFLDGILESSGSTLGTSFHGLGILYYPFTTGLVLGTSMGKTSFAVDYSLNGLAEEYRETVSDYGFNCLIAYDLDRSRTGFALQFGLRLGIIGIKAGSVIGGISFYSNFVWKENEKYN